MAAGSDRSRPEAPTCWRAIQPGNPYPPDRKSRSPNEIWTATLLSALVLGVVHPASAAQPAATEGWRVPRLDRFPIPSANSMPIEITLGPDGNLWFTESNRSKVARITPAGVITEYPTPTPSFP